MDDLLNANSVLLTKANWKLLLSDDFRKSFKKLESLQLKKDMIEVLLRLAEGRRKRNHELIDAHKLIRIYNFGELYLVWSVDFVKEDGYMQVLRVWDLLRLAEILKFIKRLNFVFSIYTDEHIHLCTATRVDGKLELPMHWRMEHKIIRYKIQSIVEHGDIHVDLLNNAKFMEHSKVDESLLWMKFYSLSSGTVRHLLTANDGSESDIPFELTDEEREMIRFPCSSFILGRSGTGKTTVMMMKLIQKEQLHHLSSDGFCYAKNDLPMIALESRDTRKEIEVNKGSFLKQLFVTVSPKLCSAIRSNIWRLKSFACGRDLPNSMTSLDMHETADSISDFSDIPDSFHLLQAEHYPLIITFQKFLMMLDGTVMTSYFERFSGTSALPSVKTGVAKSHALQAFIQSKEVNFERFVGAYWPHFNTQMTKKLDPSTVFTEIISHIKGGLVSGLAHDVRVGKEEYIMLSEKRVSVLNREKREQIYEIFLDYEKKKQRNGEFDLSDLVMYLHHQLYIGGYTSDKIDFIYIDEVQDLTMRQIALFKHVSSNFQEGFVFAGDTAQTIARGIDFRFEDIRSLFYKEFVLLSRSGYQEHRKKKGKQIADKFQLNQNFRTHAGILIFAQSIVDMLYKFFPLSIDKLSPEISLIYGEAPVLLESNKDENVIKKMFGNNSGTGRLVYGFGAEQVILVRDDCSKKEMIKSIGKQALVLTIEECKGLEFQDVLLYNFFGTSPLKDQWRVVYGYMEDHCKFEPVKQRSFPRFDECRHKILCSELKQLYVAITRTRQRLWICDTTNDYCQPMFDYWKSLCLVQVKRLDNSFAEAMGTTSSLEEWRSRGIRLFNEGNFEMATMCFERAGDGYREKWAKAAGLRVTADCLIPSNFEMGQMALKQAANIYESIGKAESAAKCFITLKDFKSAGMIYMKKCGLSRLEDAGDCFTMGECWSLAAEAYAKAKCFSKCLSTCTKAGLFDLGLCFIEQWKDDLYSDETKSKNYDSVKISYFKSCAHHFFKLGNIKHMMDFVRGFHCMEYIRPFLMSHDLLNELLQLEVESGNYLEAAKISRLKGNILLEAENLGKASYNREASQLILSYVIMKSLWKHGSSGWPLKHFSEKEDLLMKAKLLSAHESSSFYESVSLEADMLSGKTNSLFVLLQYLHGSLRFENFRLKVFSIWSILDIHLQADASKFLWKCDPVLDMGVHFDEMMSIDHFSAATLVHAWCLWKETIFNIISLMHIEFFLSFFGVRIQDNANVYVVLDPKASWIKNCGITLQKVKDLVLMNATQFNTYANHFWVEELFRVVIRVLGQLQSLNNFSFKKKLSPLHQGNIIHWMFEVAKVLNNSDCFEKKDKIGKIEPFISLSKESLFNLVFSLDLGPERAKSMIDLRENRIFLEFFDEIINDNLKSIDGKMTSWQIGRIVMLLFLSGQLTDGLFQRIGTCLDEMRPWLELVEALKVILDSPCEQVSLVLKLQGALNSTFHVQQATKDDYIPPHIFLYLVECLLFMASSCLGYGRHFFTLRSSLLENLTCSCCKGCFDSLLPVPNAHMLSSTTMVLQFISRIITELLNNKQELQKWMKRSFDRSWSYPQLLLRMINLLFLAYLNLGRVSSFVGWLSLRKNILLNLPVIFHQKLCSLKVSGSHFVRIYSETLGIIGNPLVTVCFQDYCLEFLDSNAVVIYLKDVKSREDIVAKLFSKIPENFPCSESIMVGRKGSSRGASLTCSSSILSNPTVPGEQGNYISDIQDKYNRFWKIVEEYRLENHGRLGNTRNDLCGANKLKVEESMHFLDIAARFSRQKVMSGIDGEKLEVMFNRVKVLWGLLNKPSFNKDTEDTSVPEDWYAELDELRGNLEPHMDSFFLSESQVEPKVASGSDENITKENLSGNVFATEILVEDTSDDSTSETGVGYADGKSSSRDNCVVQEVYAVSEVPITERTAQAAVAGSSGYKGKRKQKKRPKKKSKGRKK